MRSVGRVILLAVALAVLTPVASTAAVPATGPAAGRCISLHPFTGDGPAGGPFYVKATGLGTFMLYGTDGLLLGPAGKVDAPGPAAEWTPGAFAGRFRSSTATGCREFPEAELNATGKPFSGRNADGSAFGFADAHLHITADMRAGGKVIYGEAFDRYGIAAALGHDADDHGPDGILDITGNLLGSGLPLGSHDNDGWPTFKGWPTFDTLTHQQIYYRWLQRSWLAGERLVVAQTVEDEPLCTIEPLKSHSCDETATVALEVRRLRALQDYVDAQEGGPGRGWFRIVEDPQAARRAIAAGKLAVVIGVESSDLFDCSEFLGVPNCDRAKIDRGIATLRGYGVRGVFLAHWVNNALGGAALEGGTKGLFIGVLNVAQTGGAFETGACPDKTQGEPDCNTRGLTDLGAYAVRRLMDAHMLIEVDHLSEKGREQVLTLAEARHYPLVSSHTDTGGLWTPAELRRLRALGGFASARLDSPAELAKTVLAVQRNGGGFRAVGLGSDTGGFADLPGPDARQKLAYPFRSFDGRVTFDRQRSGQRTFDINTDGVAHYGLVPDLLAQVRAQPQGKQALDALFGSAEAYVRTWERTGLGPARPEVSRVSRTSRRISFRLNKAAKVRFTFQRTVGKKTTSRSFARAAKAGRNSFAFRGRIGGKALRRARYRLVVTATDAAGNQSVPARTTWRP